jgi:peptidoglycan/xylan/chitin deacetylase (PgdA/CDA1 family)
MGVQSRVGCENNSNPAERVGVGQSLAAMERLAFGRSQRMKKLSLTFDDGPSPWTLRVLEVLAKHSAPATFFMVGQVMLKAPEIVDEVRAAGHSIGNHTLTHCDLRSLTVDEIYHELGGWGDFFRPPYGFRDERVDEVARELKLPLALWDIDSFDWALQSAEEVEAQIEEQVGDGGIVLLHDGDSRGPSTDMSRTVVAVDWVISRYRELGYEFVPLSEMELPGKPRKVSL